MTLHCAQMLEKGLDKEARPYSSMAKNHVANVLCQVMDDAIQMHGDGSVSNVLVALLGSVQTAGFFLADRFCPDPRRFLRYPATGSERGRLLALTSFLGWPERGEELEFPVGATDVADLKTIDVDRRLRPGAYVCVHPGARAVERRWDPARFAHVADLLNRRGLGVVLTGGAEERAITGREK